MRELLKKAKQNSMLGHRVRRMLKLKAFAATMLAFVGLLFIGSAYATGDTAMQVISTIAIAAPAAFVIPKDLNLSDDEEKQLKAIADYLNGQFDEFQKGVIDSDALNEKVQKAFENFAKDYGIDKEKFTKLEDALKTQGLEIKILKEGKPSNAKSFGEQLKSLLSKENIQKVLDTRAPYMEKVTIESTNKAATTIMTPNASTNAPHALSYEVIPGIQEAPREELTVLSTLGKGGTTSRTIVWINRVNKDGGAAFIAEGELKPLKDWEYAEENSVAKKIAVSTKVSTEMLQDFDYMLDEIRLMLTRDLYEVVDEKLLSGTSTDEPTGILVGAGGYIGSGLDGKVFMANNADAIRAGMLQMRLLNFKPNVVFMNPTDAALMDLTKSSTGNYIKIELEGIIRTLRVIETTQIDPDKFLLMDTSRWIIKILKSFELMFGWENDDFRRNLVTVIAELRLHSYQNSIDAGSVMYESFSTVKTAIEAP